MEFTECQVTPVDVFVQGNHIIAKLEIQKVLCADLFVLKSKNLMFKSPASAIFLRFLPFF